MRFNFDGPAYIFLAKYGDEYGFSQYAARVERWLDGLCARPELIPVECVRGLDFGAVRDFRISEGYTFTDLD